MVISCFRRGGDKLLDKKSRFDFVFSHHYLCLYLKLNKITNSLLTKKENDAFILFIFVV